MRVVAILGRVLLALVDPGVGVTLSAGLGGEPFGLGTTEQLERAVRDINRLEATLENALPTNLRPSTNASQNWSPLDEEQERQEAEVNAAVAAAAQEERRASEQLAAARAQAAAVGARRHVRRFVNAGMIALIKPPPPPPAPLPASGEAAQVARSLALEAQEAGKAALHAATLAMRMAALSGGPPTLQSAPAAVATQLPPQSTQLPQPLPSSAPLQQPPSAAEAAARLEQASHVGEALAFERPAAASVAPPAAEQQRPADAPPPPPATTVLPPADAAATSGSRDEAARAAMRARMDEVAREAMRRVAAGDGKLAPEPTRLRGEAPTPEPAPSAAPWAEAAGAAPEATGAAAGGATAPTLTGGRTGYAAHWLVRGALWLYLGVMVLALLLGVVVCAGRAVRGLMGCLRQRCSPEPQRSPMLDSALGLSDGIDAARASFGAGASSTPTPPPPPPGEDSRVQDLLRSGKQNFSVSESRAVANFLARQKDLLILCGKE